MFGNGYYPNSNNAFGIHYVKMPPKQNFALMDEVAIASDTLNFGLPVGKKGYVMAFNTAEQSALRYLVRIPEIQDAWWIPECDLAPWSEYLDQTIKSAIQEHRINEALDAGDVERFKELTENI